MENEYGNTPDIPAEESAYTPRPKYQVWIARIALILFLALLAAYYINLFGGIA